MARSHALPFPVEGLSRGDKLFLVLTKVIQD